MSENNDISSTPMLGAQAPEATSQQQRTKLVELWLGILKQRLPTMSACVVSLDGSSHRFEWRQNNDAKGDLPSLDNLRAAARLARRSERLISTHDKHYLTTAGKIAGIHGQASSIGSYAVACDAPGNEQAKIEAEIERAVQWFAGFLGRFTDESLQLSETGAWLPMLLNGNTLISRLQASVNHLTQRRIAERAAIGLIKGAKVKRVVISGQREFAKRSPLQHRLRADMQQALAAWRQEGVFSPRITDHGLTLQVPLVFADRSVGVLLLDRRSGIKFSEAECEHLAAQGLLLGALIDLAKSAERDPMVRLIRSFSALLPGSSSGKIIAATLSTVLFAIAMFPMSARITAEAKIEGELQRALVAPMETYLDEVHVRAGEMVHEGDLLATFATEDLALERLKWQSERARKLKAKRDAAARQERAKLGVLEAEIAQANAEIALVESKIARSELRAPVNGVIVSGDLSQRLGSPVNKGEVLFEIVPGGHYQLAVLLDEKDVKQVTAGQKGHLKLNAFPERTLPIEIFRVTPVSEINTNGNHFVAYATIEHAGLAIKPGMHGISKIVFGERPAIVNWTRNFRRWWSLKWWQWTGWS